MINFAASRLSFPCFISTESVPRAAVKIWFEHIWPPAADFAEQFPSGCRLV